MRGAVTYSFLGYYLIYNRTHNLIRDDQIFIEGTCPGQVTYKNPFVLMNFELVR